MKKTSLLLSAGAALLSTAMPASAATLLYSFAPTTNGVAGFSFNVDSDPTVTGVDVFQFSTTVQNLIVGGITQPGTRAFTFFADAFGGGFTGSVVGTYASDRQLFTGTTSAPTLRTGIFTLTDGPSGAAGTLTVSTVAAIPEPATWAMMAVGFGLAASAMRRRKVTTRVSYAPSHR